MDCRWTLQLTWQPFSLSHQCQQRNWKPSNGKPATQGTCMVLRIAEPQLLFGILKCPAAMKSSAYSLAGEFGSIPQEAPESQELQVQLESLHEEALQIRDRYNSVRARFMRLTDVAQQLRERAALDLKLGNEDNARRLLVEKQKVMQAIELSKQRAQLLDELSIKLGEAISRKETQLIVALSSSRLKLSSSEKPTVRFIFPEGEPLVASGPDPEKKENIPIGTENMELSQIVCDGPGVVDTCRVETISAQVENMDGGGRLVTSCSGDTLAKKVDVETASKQGYFTDEHILAKGEKVEATSMVLDSDNASNAGLLRAREELGENSRDLNLQTEENLFSEEYLPEVAGASGWGGDVEESSSETGVAVLNDVTSLEDVSGEMEERDETNTEANPASKGFSAKVEEVERAGWDHDQNNEDHSLERKVVGSSREVSFGSGGTLLFEEYMMDVDQQVAVIELKLRLFLDTAVNMDKDLDNGRLYLVCQLLEQVHSMRARISEAVSRLPQQQI